MSELTAYLKKEFGFQAKSLLWWVPIAFGSMLILDYIHANPPTWYVVGGVVALILRGADSIMRPK